MQNILEHIVAERLQHDDAMLGEEDGLQEYNETMSKLREKVELYLVRKVNITLKKLPCLGLASLRLRARALSASGSVCHATGPGAGDAGDDQVHLRMPEVPRSRLR